MFYKDDKLGLFIDGYSLFGAAKSLNFTIDFKKLRSEFSRRGKLSFVKYYTLLDEKDEDNPIRPMVDWLSYNGFHVLKKQPYVYQDEEGGKRFKGSIDVEMAVDLLTSAAHLDHAVIFSGSKDMSYAVAAAQRLGCRVSVVSTIKSLTIACSDDLRRQSDNFIELDGLRDVIEKEYTNGS